METLSLDILREIYLYLDPLSYSRLTSCNRTFRRIGLDQELRLRATRDKKNKYLGEKDWRLQVGPLGYALIYGTFNLEPTNIKVSLVESCIYLYLTCPIDIHGYLRDIMEINLEIVEELSTYEYNLKVPICKGKAYGEVLIPPDFIRGEFSNLVSKVYFKGYLTMSGNKNLSVGLANKYICYDSSGNILCIKEDSREKPSFGLEENEDFSLEVNHVEDLIRPFGLTPQDNGPEVRLFLRNILNWVVDPLLNLRYG